MRARAVVGAIVLVLATAHGAAADVQPGKGFRAGHDVYAFGSAAPHGSTGTVPLNQPVVGIAPTHTGRGYWLVARDGGIFSFGDAVFRGSTGAIRLNQPIVGMASDPRGRGYWFVAADGGVFAFGVPFHGSLGAAGAASPIVGMAATGTGGGYWLVAADGGVFAFGDAGFRGSAAGRVTSRVVGMARDPDGSGYWLAEEGGRIWSFDADAVPAVFVGDGDAVVGIAASDNGFGDGAWVALRSGRVDAFGANYHGSVGNHAPWPLVGIAPHPDGAGYWLAAAKLGPPPPSSYTPPTILDGLDASECARSDGEIEYDVWPPGSGRHRVTDSGTVVPITERNADGWPTSHGWVLVAWLGDQGCGLEWVRY